MTALAAHVRSLHHGSLHILLNVEVITQQASALEIRIYCADGAAAGGRHREGIRHKNVAGVAYRGRKRRIRAQVGDHVGHRLIVIESRAGANHGLALACGIVSETDTRAKICKLLRVWFLAVGSFRDYLVEGEVENAQAIVDFARHTVVFPAQAQIQGEAGRHFEVILYEGVEGASAQRRAYREGCFGGLRGRAGQEVRHCSEGNQAARAVVEVVVAETPELCPEFDRVFPMDPGHRIGILEGGVAASLRESANASKGEVPRKHRSGRCNAEALRSAAVRLEEIDTHAV